MLKGMKVIGIIPNAVAILLNGHCKNGLTQAMKLSTLMLEKGTIPNVDGLCKVHKANDIKKIFRKRNHSS
uniref:Uncharacterized protein n=1 Tax=Manihot esculenta TaxID=3983 RepID=A0A2C9UX70_MANES